ncbi:hypothetical protein LWC33_02410 [Pseudonocardia sp. RS11V-5]|uniref:hypothetical protein n=1 Tax=Pseudonocardia terrae TaxID=2905831 RepID=UPI001E47E993|nr:hypothetical protein [Pseudonocardia terrae]MCE3550310.1 hypothetical protein [Pseudonocardia terrae]
MQSRPGPLRAGPPAGPAPARVLRGVVLASLSTLLTALGHLAGGGTLGDLGLLVVLLPLLALAVTSTAERVRGPLGTLLVLGGGQFVLHELLELLGHDHTGVASGPQMLAGHAVATVLSGLLLRDVDRLLSALARALRRVLPRRLAPLRADAPLRTLAVPAAGVAGHVRRAAVGAVLRRGPPAPGPIAAT